MADDAPTEKELSLLEHLEELRERLIKAIIALLLAMVAGYFVAPHVLDLLVKPIIRAQGFVEQARETRALTLTIRDDGTLALLGSPTVEELGDVSRLEFQVEGMEQPVAFFGHRAPAPLLYLRPIDPFMIRLKASLFVGLFLVMPFLLYQFWAFIAPGLLKRERRVVLPLILAGTILFPLGAAFAYFILDFALRFFSSFVIDSSVMFNDANAYLGFVLTMMLAFGILFELPLGLVLAMHAGVVSPQWLAARRKYIFIILLIASALITPTGDPVSLMALALPLQFLFEVSLVVGRFLHRRAEEDIAAEDSEFDEIEPEEPRE